VLHVVKIIFKTKNLKMDNVVRIPLNHCCLPGSSIPQFGFGTYRLKKKAVVEPLSHALSVGVPLVDTAAVYNNEQQIGSVLSGLESEHHSLPYVVTKLWRSDQSNEAARIEQSLRDSLRALRLQHVDCWLLHWPGPGRHVTKHYACPSSWSPAMRVQTVRHMAALIGKGCNAVGVSNFSVRQLQQLIDAGVCPAINQVECHPFLVQRELRDYCAQHGIVVMAYNSLGQGEKEILEHPVVVRIANEKQRTVAQVLLRWGLQHNMVVIPGSSNKAHIEENTRVFDFSLSEKDMSDLDALDCGKRLAWKGEDPDNVDVPIREWGDKWDGQ
jgi:diketogulonate reductase-like aldo/keto reductase